MRKHEKRLLVCAVLVILITISIPSLYAYELERWAYLMMFVDAVFGVLTFVAYMMGEFRR